MVQWHFELHTWHHMADRSVSGRQGPSPGRVDFRDAMLRRLPTRQNFKPRSRKRMVTIASKPGKQDLGLRSVNDQNWKKETKLRSCELEACPMLVEQKHRFPNPSGALSS